MNKKVVKILAIAGLSIAGLSVPAGVQAHASQVRVLRPSLAKQTKPVQKSVQKVQSNRKNLNIQNNKLTNIERVAKSKLGHKYSWGATGPKRFDCSGFTQYVFKHGAHKHLARTAQAQYNDAKHISNKSRKAGDLVFFGGSKHSISHVGLYLGHDKMIDAQNRGVIVEHVHAPWWHLVGYSRPIKF